MQSTGLSPAQMSCISIRISSNQTVKQVMVILGHLVVTGVDYLEFYLVKRNDGNITNNSNNNKNNNNSNSNNNNNNNNNNHNNNNNNNNNKTIIIKQ
ncbi:hypothetical protein PoB_004676100 [Plakobranchus ocellatus]|uniref:Uncharacterized protein n=1 Tax=Plakobranchus ocellatus TaxID=259542 RepID=A0AAV4BIJ6_9GAST|nr:hypothetical protein PoB_004676100 [Plakobranchus ocellatus]